MSFPQGTEPQPSDTRFVSWAKITRLAWDWRATKGGSVNAANEPQQSDTIYLLMRKTNGLLQEIADNP